MGLNTVSEGVETIDQLQALQALGADHIQGFLIARPMHPDGLQTWALTRPQDLAEAWCDHVGPVLAEHGVPSLT